MSALRPILAVITAAFVVASIQAQEDATVETSPTAAQEIRAAQRKLDTERRAKEALEGKPILTYGGFLVEFSRAEKKRKLLSLRQPADPKNDYKHVYFDERTARPKGVVLFSMGF